MQVIETTFNEIKSNVKNKEGIVCFGAGGDPQEYTDLFSL
jgi:hypothetical protein